MYPVIVRTRLFRRSLLGILSGAAIADIFTDREGFKKRVKIAAAVTAPCVALGGLWSHLHNRAYFSKNVIISCSGIALGTVSLLVGRTLIAHTKAPGNEAFDFFPLPDRDSIFFEHGLSAGSGAFTATLLLSFFRAEAIRVAQGGVLGGLFVGFVGQVGFELFQWWLKEKHREQTIRLHFPHLAHEMKTNGYLHFGLKTPEYPTANAWVLDQLRDFTHVFSTAKANILEVQVQLVDEEICKEMREIERLDERLAELRAETGEE